MNPRTPGGAEPTAGASGNRRSRRFGIAVNGGELRRQMRLRGLTGSAVADGAHVSPATVSQAVNDRRIHPRKLHAIVAYVSSITPLEVLEQFAASGELSGEAERA